MALEVRGYATPCWIWQLSRNHYGYGQGTRPGCSAAEGAHRISYQAFVGPIPSGLHLDHLCRVRECCNPEHLEPVTTAENTQRAMPFRQIKTHCNRGHEIAGKNVLMGQGGRRCRRCAYDWNNKFGPKHRKPPANPKTHCAKGHELTPENTIVSKNGQRRCRACNLQWQAVRQRKAAAQNSSAGGEAQRAQRPVAEGMFRTHSESVDNS